MQHTLRTSLFIVGALGGTVTSLVAQQSVAPATNWSLVETALGRKGALQAGDVIKFAFPRSDLSVTSNGVALKPAFALGSWIAFKQVDKGASIAMGDLVLLDSEVSTVMRALQDGGVEQSALHNHVLNESPQVMYMHISAHGDASKIAKVVHDALALSKTPIGAPSAVAIPSAADLDTAGIAKAIGVTGKLNGVVYQITVPRSEKIMEMGYEIPPS
ncbi:MAG: DUF1259 domain-containing protein, partial [Gemmatimonadaceae bacterium]